MNEGRLRMWQERLNKLETDYRAELDRMDERERYYLGEEEVRNIDGTKSKALHNRNIIAENIEAQVSSAIPQPKVRALHEGDEELAEIIERMIRDDLDRLPMERLNDMDERTTPIQGANGWMVEWDSGIKKHDRSGDVSISLVHPKRILPQTGVTEIEDMDYFILQVPETKNSIAVRYGVELGDEGEEKPELRSGTDSEAQDSEMVTLYIGYEKVGNGINKYGFVNDTEIFDEEDYRARRGRQCKKCGAMEPIEGTELGGGLENALTSRAMGLAPEKRKWHRGDACPRCGGTEWTEGALDKQTLYAPVFTSRGGVVKVGYDEPVQIPMCKPEVYPVCLRKNVSVFGKFLGDSDVDKIKDQQNTISVMENKILHRFCDAGTKISLPNDPGVTLDKRDQRVIHVKQASDLAMIKTFDFSGDLSQEMVYLSNVYQEARQAIGITEAYLGERDTTAQSGAAKQVSAQQAAGRLESKRVMKEAVYQELFQRIFLLHLAYDDRPRRFSYQDENGETQWTEFDRYDFLKTDDAGEYYWNTDFLFSCDSSQPLANNRERMWQELTQFYTSGAFGDPAAAETRLLFWERMEALHYPGAAATKKQLQAEMERQQAMQEQMMQQQAMIEEQARQDAMRDTMR